jgi:uncharacterized protein (DUF433 family)
MPATLQRHIALDQHGRAIIEGTRWRITQIAQHRNAPGWDIDAFHDDFPDLTLGQIHAALSYYYDHQEAVDAELAAGIEEVRELRQRLENPALQAKLAALAAARDGL